MPLPIPLFGKPPILTWVIVNADTPLELPLIGQFDPEAKISAGKPMWSKKPGIAGGAPWLKYVGKKNGELKFTFHCIAVNGIDLYPMMALAKLQELASVDKDLGHPPRVYFAYGLMIVEGFITDLPDVFPTKTWFRTSVIREVGPVEVGITILPAEEIQLFSGTNFIMRTDDIKFEELSKNQYQDARFGQALDKFNQGVKVNEILELPKRSNPAITRTVPTAPGWDDSIEGL